MGLDAKLAAIPDADVRIHAVLGFNGIGPLIEQFFEETLIQPETPVFGLKLHFARGRCNVQKHLLVLQFSQNFNPPRSPFHEATIL